MHLRHGTQNFRMMFEEVREVNPARAIVFDWPREMPQVAEHVCRRARLAIEADRRWLLFLLSASYVENKHDEKHSGRFFNTQRRATRHKNGAESRRIGGNTGNRRCCGRRGSSHSP